MPYSFYNNLQFLIQWNFSTIVFLLVYKKCWNISIIFLVFLNNTVRNFRLYETIHSDYDKISTCSSKNFFSIKLKFTTGSPSKAQKVFITAYNTLIGLVQEAIYFSLVLNTNERKPFNQFTAQISSYILKKVIVLC